MTRYVTYCQVQFLGYRDVMARHRASCFNTNRKYAILFTTIILVYFKRLYSPAVQERPYGDTRSDQKVPGLLKLRGNREC